MKCTKTYYHKGRFLFLPGDQWPEKPEHVNVCRLQCGQWLCACQLYVDQVNEYLQHMSSALDQAKPFEDQDEISVIVADTGSGPFDEVLYTIPEIDVEWHWVNPCIPERRCLKDIENPCKQNCEKQYLTARIARIIPQEESKNDILLVSSTNNDTSNPQPINFPESKEEQEELWNELMDEWREASERLSGERTLEYMKKKFTITRK